MSEGYGVVKDLSQNMSETADVQGFFQNRDLVETNVSLNIIYIRSISKIKYIYLIKPCLHRSIVYKIIKKYLISALTNLTFYSTVLISYYFLRKRELGNKG